MMFPQTLYTVSGNFRYALIIFVTKIYIFKTSIKSPRNNWILLITFNYYLISAFQANKHKSFMTKRFVTVWTFVIQSWSLQLKLVCLEIIFFFLLQYCWLLCVIVCQEKRTNSSTIILKMKSTKLQLFTNEKQGPVGLIILTLDNNLDLKWNMNY